MAAEGVGDTVEMAVVLRGDLWVRGAPGSAVRALGGGLGCHQGAHTAWCLVPERVRAGQLGLSFSCGLGQAAASVQVLPSPWWQEDGMTCWAPGRPWRGPR